ncbi:hypothetical protein KY290_021896 [Solanum tuberosum]|uniref:Uncharacterized protein n=1 Tax=Solanum tuberosum TaxID=4113 RepID=A0ABQ7V2U5_SOLTU|nr:hypothetical protein KY289_021053 [Solanum tuberosum]KAH0758403.1 hypothetical protein KY290_021896 [Solanum tuberosum]
MRSDSGSAASALHNPSSSDYSPRITPSQDDSAVIIQKRKLGKKAKSYAYRIREHGTEIGFEVFRNGKGEIEDSERRREKKYIQAYIFLLPIGACINREHEIGSWVQWNKGGRPFLEKQLQGHASYNIILNLFLLYKKPVAALPAGG